MSTFLKRHKALKNKPIQKLKKVKKTIDLIKYICYIRSTAAKWYDDL